MRFATHCGDYLEHVAFIGIHAACSNFFGGVNSFRLLESNPMERALVLTHQLQIAEATGGFD